MPASPARASRSAAAGGVTTCCDMPYDIPAPVTNADLLAQKIKVVNATSHVDMALYGTILKTGGVPAIADLAAACGVREVPLLQVVRALAGFGIFVVDGGGRVSLNGEARRLLAEGLRPTLPDAELRYEARLAFQHYPLAFRQAGADGTEATDRAQQGHRPNLDRAVGADDEGVGAVLPHLDRLRRHHQQAGIHPQRHR